MVNKISFCFFKLDKTFFFLFIILTSFFNQIQQDELNDTIFDMIRK